MTSGTDCMTSIEIAQVDEPSIELAITAGRVSPKTSLELRGTSDLEGQQGPVRSTRIKPTTS
jgi:hypothetical protein